MKADQDLGKIALYLSPEHPCEYLQDRLASTLFTDPEMQMSPQHYEFFMQSGFRRSGDAIYSPKCGSCQSCISLRIPVREFKIGRSGRRVLNKNNNLQRSLVNALDDEHIDLLTSYLSDRHAGGSMENQEPEQVIKFFESQWCETGFLEYRKGAQLLAVSVIDLLPEALSAVYSFFESSPSQRSLGTYAILDAVQFARQNDLNFLYLGYWIANCQKMKYKSRFLPHELFYNGQWHRIENASQSEHFIENLQKTGFSV